MTGQVKRKRGGGRSHGLSKHPLYKVWGNMRKRCRNGQTGYKGVQVHTEWVEFVPFYEWAITHDWRDGLSLDRIDPNGDYEPDNCRWVHPEEQADNTKATRRARRTTSAKYVRTLRKTIEALQDVLELLEEELA